MSNLAYSPAIPSTVEMKIKTRIKAALHMDALLLRMRCTWMHFYWACAAVAHLPPPLSSDDVMPIVRAAAGYLALAPGF